MQRIVIGLHYEGVFFHGWQSQPDCITVQGVLEKALSNFSQENIRVVVAGRTDAGVHALGQVAHFDTNVKRSNFSWVRGTNSFLPKTVCVRWAAVLPKDFHARDFHARFSAIERTYDYILVCNPVRPALCNQRVGWIHESLDIEAMRKASSLLIGFNDFSSFRSSQCQAKSPCKILYSIRIVKDNDVIRVRFVANAFLHHMVRNIIGCLVVVGRRKKTPLWIGEVLASRDRAAAAPTFSPAGLYLSSVKYNEKFSFINEVIEKDKLFSENFLPCRIPLLDH